MTVSEIQRKIEDKREEMYLVANSLGIGNPKVVMISEELDHLINQFNTNKPLHKEPINISKSRV